MNEYKDCTQAKLIEAGEVLFGNFGFDAVTVRQATTIVGVNVSSISYYFENKVGYYQAVINHLIYKIINQLGQFDISRFEELDLPLMQHQLRQIIEFFYQFSMSKDGIYLSNIFLRESVTNNTGHAGSALSELIIFIHNYFARIFTIYYKKLNEPDTDINFVIMTMISLIQKISTRECKPDAAKKLLNDDLFVKLLEFILFKRF